MDDDLFCNSAQHGIKGNKLGAMWVVQPNSRASFSIFI